MRKSKVLYSIFIVQVHTTALSFLFSETKSKRKNHAYYNRLKRVIPCFQ